MSEATPSSTVTPAPAGAEGANPDLPLLHDPFKKLSASGLTMGLIAILLMFRLFAVSKWNWHVATELVDSFTLDDAISIGFGTLFERPHVTGAVLALAIPLSLFHDYWLARSKDTKARAGNWFLIVGMVTIVYVLVRTFDMWWPAIVATVLTVALLAIAALWTRGKGRPLLARLGKPVGLFLAAAFLALAVSIETPWMSRERIETEGQTFYGYVLETNPGFLKILTDDREVLIMPDEDVLSRTIMETD